MNAENDWMEEDEYLQVDFNSMQHKQHKIGYVEGITAGKEYMLQESFNQAFKTGFSYFKKLSRLRGCLSALHFNLSSKDALTEAQLLKIETLIHECDKFEMDQCHDDKLYSQRLRLLNKEKVTGQTETPLTRNDATVDDVCALIDDLKPLHTASSATKKSDKTESASSSSSSSMKDYMVEQKQEIKDFIGHSDQLELHIQTILFEMKEYLDETIILKLTNVLNS